MNLKHRSTRDHRALAWMRLFFSLSGVSADRDTHGVEGGVLMSIRNLAYSIVLPILVLGVPPAFAQDTPCTRGGGALEDGGCWNTLTHDEKEGIVIGIFVGQKSTLLGDFSGSIVASHRRNWVAVPPTAHVPDFINYFDMLYNIPANRDITWEWASILAAMNARDDSTTDGAALIRFLREHTALPTSGEIVGVKAPDVITIMSSQDQYDIHLDGVTSKGLTDAQQNMAIAFLRGLSQADLDQGSGCNKPSHLPVVLVYRTQLFQNGGALSAIVMLSPFITVCDNGVNLPLFNLSGYFFEDFGFMMQQRPNLVQSGPELLDLNRLLVSSGLALPDPVVDPKWPDAIANDRSLIESAAREAKQRKLYVYGDGRDPVIDEVIAYGSKLLAGK